MTPESPLEPPPYNLMFPLLELQDYYAGLLEEYERKASQARLQLEHIDGLLTNWSNFDKPINIPATIPQDLLLVENTAAVSSDVLHQEPTQDETIDDSLPEIDVVKEVPDADEQSPQEPEKTPAQSPQYVTTVSSNQNSNKATDIPMVSEYQSLSRMQAIEKLLHNNTGTVCHIDFIVRSLYGDLDQKLFKVVKGRVHSSLTHGKEKNYWAAIPDEPGCYTLDLNLVTANNRKAQSKTIKSKKRKPFVLPRTKRVAMLPQFDGQFLIDAISSYLESNPRKTFSVAEIILGVYGELDAEQLREIKSPVLNELSRGYRIGKFSRVPNKVGFYCWDSNN